MTQVPAGLKLVAMIAAHAAVCTIIAVAMIENAHFQSARGVFGAQYSFAVFMIPSVLSFAISAWIVRTRWANLRFTQVVAAGLSLGLLTVTVMVVFVFLLVPFFETRIVSVVGTRVIMVFPGIIAAQLLRIGAKRRVALTAVDQD